MANEASRQTLYVQLQCQEPLHLGTRRPYGQFRSNETILRGGRVLAGLAAAQGGTGLLEVPGRVIVEDSPAFAAGGRLLDEVVHLPLTAETCKVLPGASWDDPEALRQRDQDVPHGIWDTLLARWAFAAGWPGHRHWGLCRECERQTGRMGAAKPLVLFVQRRRNDFESAPLYGYELIQPAAECRAHTALNPTRGTAEFHLLFADELVLPGTSFYVRVRVQGQTDQERESCAQVIRELIQKPLRLGGAKSRGHGLMLGFLDEEGPPVEPIPDRLCRFDGLVKRQAVDSGCRLDERRTYFTVTLQAPLLLPDQDVYPEWRLGPSYDDWKRVFPLLAPAPAGPLAETHLEFVQHRFTQVTGWSSLWQLPKPALRALAAGSVYLFSTKAGLSEVAPVAADLEFAGAGLRRAEGFGAIYVSDPFHREVQPHGAVP